MLDDILFGIFKFFGWLISEIIFYGFIEPLIYAIGKNILKIISLGYCRVDKPSRTMDAVIYFTGAVFLFISILFIFFGIKRIIGF